MKKLLSLLLCFVILSSFMSLCVSADFTDGSIAITCEDGKIVVSGTFTGAEAGENYNIILANYNEDTTLKRIIGISDPVAITAGTNTVSYSVDIPDLMADSELVKAYIWTESLEPICAPAQKEITSLKVLSIGNSFSQDGLQHLYHVAKDGGIDNVVLGMAIIGGCTLKTHWTNVEGSLEAYGYSKNTTGTWVGKKSQTLSTILQDEKWNLITMQQASRYSGLPEDSSEPFDPYLTNLINWVNENKTNPDARLAWQMTWAYAQSCSSDAFDGYDNDQLTMYNAIVEAAQEKIVPNEAFDFIIPSGTTIQNLRTSFMGDTLNRDGVHLSYNVGRYAAALTWYKKITGRSIENMTWVPAESTDVEVTADYHLPAVKEAVNNAISTPFSVTPSNCLTAPPAETVTDPGPVDAPSGVLIDYSTISAEASSTYGSSNPANVVDGITDNDSVRWSSNCGTSYENGAQSITLNLGGVKTISDIGIHWLSGTDRNYYFSIEVSTDGTTFSPIENLGAYTADSTDEVATQLEAMITNEKKSPAYYCLGDVQAQYIRYWGYGNSKNKYNHLLEIEVYQAPGVTSAPRGTKTTIVEATDSNYGKDESEYYGTQDSYPASNAIDGSTADASRWTAFCGNSDCYLQSLTLDLGGVKNVSDIGIYWFKGSSRNYYFSIEVSEDGVTYTPVRNLGTCDPTDTTTDNTYANTMLSSNKKQPGYFYLGDVEARYIRYWSYGYQGYSHVLEIEVYQTPGVTSTPVGTQVDIASATGSSKTSETYTAANAIDGDTADSSRWTADCGTNYTDGAQSLTLDLGSVKAVSDIGISWLKGSSRNYYFCIEVSKDGETYTPVRNLGAYNPDNPTTSKLTMITSGKKNTGYFYLDNIEAQYIRYWGYGSDTTQEGANTANHIVEFEVYQKTAE